MLNPSEIWASVVDAGPLIVSGVIALTYYLQRRAQRKLDSAHLILKLDEQLVSKDFRDLTDALDNSKYDDSMKNMLVRYLGHVDMICMFHYNGLIDEYHMGEQYDPLILDCCGDGIMVKHLLQSSEKAYIPLKKRMRYLKPNVFDLP